MKTFSYRKYDILKSIESGNEVSIGIASDVGMRGNVVSRLLVHYHKLGYIEKTGKRSYYNTWQLTDKGRDYIQWYEREQ